VEAVVKMDGGRTNNLLLQMRVSDDINYYRQFGLLNPHTPGSRFWSSLPYDIPKHYLFDYLSKIETFTRTYPGATMYLYGLAILPIPVTASVRQYVCEILLTSLPEAVFELVEGIRFCLSFHYNEYRMNLDIRSMYVLPGRSLLFLFRELRQNPFSRPTMYIEGTMCSPLSVISTITTLYHNTIYQVFFTTTLGNV